jgi:hypothetical protein
VHNLELHNLYSSSSIIRVIKSISIEWARNVAGVGEMRNEYKVLARQV